MSADNWAACPRCLQTEITARRCAEDKLREAYGKVPVKEYELMATRLPVIETNTDFREDYSICNDDRGTVTIEYSGDCNECGLSVRFERSIDLMEEA